MKIKRGLALVFVIIISLSGCSNISDAFNQYNINIDNEDGLLAVAGVEDGSIKVTMPKEENISLDEETEMRFMNNEILVTFDENVSKEEAEKIIRDNNCEIIGQITYINKYQLRTPVAYSYSQIKDLSEKFKAYDGVIDANVNQVLNIDNSCIGCSLIGEFSDVEEGEGENIDWGSEEINLSSNWGLRAVNALEMWSSIYFPKDRSELSPVNVGILEVSYINADCEDIAFAEEPLFNKYVADYYKKETHGISVASIIGSSMEGEHGICGIYPDSNMYGASITGGSKGTNNLSSEYIIEAGLCYLICENNCKVVNCSFGYNDITFPASRGNSKALRASEELKNEFTSFFNVLLDRDYDFLIVKAAGNINSTNGERRVMFVRKDSNVRNSNANYDYIPYKADGDKDYYKGAIKSLGPLWELDKSRIDYGNVGTKYDIFSNITDERIADRIIVVGASKIVGTNSYEVCDFSNGGSDFTSDNGVDLTAPGEDVAIHYMQDGQHKTIYKEKMGTSLSAPYVTGVAAAMFAVNPSLNASTVKNILCSTTYSDVHMLDANAAVNKAKNTTIIPTIDIEDDKTPLEENDNIDELDILHNMDYTPYIGKWELDKYYDDHAESEIEFDDIKLSINDISYRSSNITLESGLFNNTTNFTSKIPKVYDGEVYVDIKADAFIYNRDYSIKLEGNRILLYEVDNPDSEKFRDMELICSLKKVVDSSLSDEEILNNIDYSQYIGGWLFERSYDDKGNEFPYRDDIGVSVDSLSNSEFSVNLFTSIITRPDADHRFLDRTNSISKVPYVYNGEVYVNVSVQETEFSEDYAIKLMPGKLLVCEVNATDEGNIINMVPLWYLYKN